MYATLTQQSHLTLNHVHLLLKKNTDLLRKGFHLNSLAPRAEVVLEGGGGLVKAGHLIEEILRVLCQIWCPVY